MEDKIKKLLKEVQENKEMYNISEQSTQSWNEYDIGYHEAKFYTLEEIEEELKNILKES